MCAAFIALAFAIGGYIGLWAGRRQGRAEATLSVSAAANDDSITTAV